MIKNSLHLHCYIHNVSADSSFGLLQEFHVELESLHPLFNPQVSIVLILSTMTGLNKGFGLKFHVGGKIRQKTPEEGRRTYRPKLYV